MTRTIRTNLSVLFYLFLAAYCLVIFYPLYLMVVTSLKPNAEVFANPFGFPAGLYLDNYAAMVSRSNYGAYFRNSLVVVALVTAAVLVLSSPAAYVLAKYRFRGAALLYTALLSMEPSTREWFLARPELARRLSESARGALTVAAPYLRLDGGRWRLPGGAFAEPVWADLVGVDPAAGRIDTDTVHRAFSARAAA